MAVPVMPEYMWLVITGAFAAFGFGWGTGSNDVANAFGTSVGAKTITLRQAVIIAAIFEFGGAILLGRVVTNTIAGGIADPSAFSRQPEIYAYGMVCALTVGFLWQWFASWKGLNVSATHSIIGAIIGFAVTFGGAKAVQWARPDPAAFPPYRGVVPIIMSWFFSPILTGATSAFIFWLVRTTVLRRQNARKLALWVLPPAVLVATWINIFFVFTRGAARTLGSTWSVARSAWISAVIAVGTALLAAVVAVPLLRMKLNKRNKEVEAKAAEPDPKSIEVVACDSGLEEPQAKGFGGRIKSWAIKAKTAVLYGTSVDVHQVVEEDPYIAELHERAEKFDEEAEFAFGYLQVFSAICVIFAHGAGEVGFMSGPLSCIYDMYMNGRLATSLEPPIWIVIIAAFSLVAGLATYGYNVTRTMGVAMAKLSPSRGFAAELATALVILVASQLGLPTSSSQCITGGIVGVGLMEGFKKGVNWKLFGKQFISWACTLFVVGLGTAAIFAQGIFTPSKIDGGAVLMYENGLASANAQMIGSFNSTLLGLQEASNAGALRTLPPSRWAELNQTLASLNKTNAGFTATSGNTAVSPREVLRTVNSSMSLFQNNSIFTLGQNNVYPGAPVCNSNVTAEIKEGVKVACQSPPITAVAKKSR